MLTCETGEPGGDIRAALSASELPDGSGSPSSGELDCASEEGPSRSMDVDEHHGKETASTSETVGQVEEVAPSPPLASAPGTAAPPRKRPVAPGSVLKPYLQALRNTPGMLKYYEIEGRSTSSCRIKIAKRDPNGYRFHPLTVHLLGEYYSRIADVAGADAAIPSTVELHGRFPGLWTLIALLIQDATTRDVVREIWEILANSFIRPPATLDTSLAAMVTTLADYVDYGAGTELQDAGELPSTRCDLHVWEVKDPSSLLPPTLAETILERQSLRRMYSQVLRGPVASATARSGDRAGMTASPMTVSGHDSLAKGAEARPAPTETVAKRGTVPSAVASRKQAAQSLLTKGIVKISSFFSVVRREPEGSRDSSVLFQPFFPKPSTTVAPANLFPTPSPAERFDCELPARVPLRRRFASTSRPKYCKCIGYDLRPVLSIAKLIQFHENYRPAYFGTLASARELGRVRSAKARAPCARALADLDYDYDSDDDWGDDADIEDAESISDSDEHSEEEESLPSEMTDEEDSGWLVPDGGVVGSDSSAGEHGSAAKAAMFMATEPNGITWMSRTCNPHESKRRHIEKTPVIVGPYRDGGRSGGEVPSPELAAIVFVWSGSGPLGEAVMAVDPLEGTHVLEGAGKQRIAQNAVSITDDMLRTLAPLVDGSRHGVGRLLELFTAHAGGIKVSRRQFELKLNQIAAKQPSRSDAKPAWMIRPEFAYLLARARDDAEQTRRIEGDPQPARHHPSLNPSGVL